MLRNSDTDVKLVISLFSRLETGIALIVPTTTGLTKSIIDATDNVRTHFRETGFHDYGNQAQGTLSKVVKQAYFVYGNETRPTKISLYRPSTKSGDPRLWIYGLNKYSEAGNLIAIFTTSEDAFIINCSDPQNRDALRDKDSKIVHLIRQSIPYLSTPAYRLKAMIEDIAKKGFVRSRRKGSTGVGMTLEAHLGIDPNSSKLPDYEGIELKAKRLDGRTRTRTTLFSQSPNWDLSPIGSAWNLLATYGYHRNGKLRLNHQISALKPNSLGFVLQIDPKIGWLKQNYVNQTGKQKHITTWVLSHLRARLSEKHPETFWVGAESRLRNDGDEEFRYVEIQHTKKPMISNFDILIETGVISVDYLMSERSEGSVRDHGYLFKMYQNDFHLLFPPPVIYNLR